MAGAQLNRGVTKGQGRIVRGQAEAVRPESRAKGKNNKHNRKVGKAKRSTGQRGNVKWGTLRVIAARDVPDRGLELWNILAFLILGLSTPLAPEQRATGRSRRPFLISVHELPGAE